MADSVYKVIELVGTSTESWEKAAQQAIEQTSKTLETSALLKSSRWTSRLTKGRCAPIGQRSRCHSNT